MPSLGNTSLGIDLQDHPGYDQPQACPPGERWNSVFQTCVSSWKNVICGSGQVWSDVHGSCVQEGTTLSCPSGQWLNPSGKCEGPGATTAPAPKPASAGGGGYVAPKPADAPPAPVEAGMSTTSKVAVPLVVCAVGLVGYKVAKKRGMF